MRSTLIRRLLTLSVALGWLVPISAGASQQEAGREAAKLALGGRLHLRYATSSADGSAGDVQVLRARIRLDVQVNEHLDGRLQPEFATGRPALEDAYMRLALAPALRLSLGQFKRAFSAFELASSADLPVVDRDGLIEGAGSCPGVGQLCSFSRLAEDLAFDGRDMGLRLEGVLGGGVSYMATATYGKGTDAAELTDGKSFSGRLTHKMGSMRVGAFAALHDHRTAATARTGRTEYAHALGIDAEIGTWRDGLHLVAGLVRGENWKVGPEASFTALQGLASLYLPVNAPSLAGVEPMLRVGWARGGGGAPDGAGALVTPGLTVYFSGQNGLTANLDVYSPSGGGDRAWSLKIMTLLYY